MALVFFQSDPFTYPGGGIAAGVKVRVLFDGTTVLAPIYYDSAGARKPNPLRTDEAGLVDFYIEPGDYQMFANGLYFPFTVDAGGAGLEAAATAIVMSVGSPGGVGVGKGRFYNDTGRTLDLTSIRVTALNVAGGGLLVDVNKNGVSIYTAQQNRPAIAAGAGTGTVKNVGFDAGTALQDGAYMSFDVDQGTYDHLVVQAFVR